MLKYYLFRIAIVTLSFLPVRVGYFIACLTGDLAYFLARNTRRIVSSNIRRALGAKAEDKKLRQTVRSVFRNNAKNYFDLIRLPRFNLEYLNGNLTVQGWNYFEEALQRGKGVILASAHLGNLDLVAQVLAARSIKLTVLVEPLEPQPLFRLISGLRESKGVSFLPADLTGLKVALRSLRRGEAVAIACDRNILGDGLRLNFLGEETTIPVGAVELAMRTGATLIPAFSVRLQEDRYAVYAEPPLSLATQGDHQDDLRENLGKMVALMEKYIRRYPEQWVVFSPIWD